MTIVYNNDTIKERERQSKGRIRMEQVATSGTRIAEMTQGVLYVFDTRQELYCHGYEVVRGEGTFTWLPFWEQDGKRRYHEMAEFPFEPMAIEMKDKSFRLNAENVGERPVEELTLDDAFFTMLELYLEIDAENSDFPEEDQDFGRYVSIAEMKSENTNGQEWKQLKKHQWEPSDNQGHAVECTECGIGVSFLNTKEWNTTLHGACEGKKANKQ